MSITGLCVKDLDATQISKKLEIYVAKHCQGYKLGTCQNMFMEVYMFYFDEVKDIIPTKHHHLFTDESKFNGMSGYVTIGSVGDEADERIISVLMDEHSAYAYLLCLHEPNEEGEENIIIIGDFICT